MTATELIDQYCTRFPVRHSLDTGVTVDNRRTEAEQDLTERLVAEQWPIGRDWLVERAGAAREEGG